MNELKFTMIDKINVEYFLPLLPREAKGAEVMAGVIMDKRPAGALLANMSGQTASIISLFVLPELRRRKVATFLLGQFCSEFGKRGVDMVFAYGPDEDGVKECLVSNGFSIASVDKYYAVRISKLINDPALINKLKSYKKASAGRTVLPMKDVRLRIPEPSIRAFSKILDKRGINPSAFINGGYDEKLSFATIMGANISGIMLTNRTEIGSDVVVESLITISDKMDILALLSRFGVDVIHVIGEKGVVCFVTGDTNTQKLVGKLLGEHVMTVRNAIHAGKRIEAR
ncbi:MAG: GNAT family N-acetyltransferase [Butyrivibrio sp.]|nr:GNAT family N-acetyltransferase [Butyrivibrio sp.]